MLQYYRNPKTENLIIWDSEENSLLILGRIEKVQLFLEDDLLHPSKKNDDQIVGNQSYFGKETPNKKRDSKQISPEQIERIKEMKEDGATMKEIIKEVGVSQMTVYKYLK